MDKMIREDPNAAGLHPRVQPLGPPLYIPAYSTAPWVITDEPPMRPTPIRVFREQVWLLADGSMRRFRDLVEKERLCVWEL